MIDLACPDCDHRPVPPGAAPCVTCAGRFRVSVACAVSIADELHVLRFARAYARLRNHGIWPTSGGADRQPATFVEASDLMDSFVSQSQVRQRERERQRLERERGRR